MERLAERTAVRLALFALVAAALVWPMLGHAGFLNEFRDAQVLALHEHAAVDSVLRFGQLPLWDPWYCGGLYGLGAPQSRFAAPPFVLSVLFGPERAEPVVVFALAMLGMEGTYRWVRLRVSDASAALRVAPVFALSGHFAVALFRGWTNFFGFELLPFVLLGVTKTARGKLDGIAIASIAFAVMLGFGGTFAAPIVAVAVTVEALRALVEVPRPARGRAVLMLGALASFMLTVAAARLLPVAETLMAAPRIMAGTPGHSAKMILYALVKGLEARSSDIADPGTFYVGPVFLALVALGGSDRKSARPLVAAIVFLWLAAGYARKPPLFALLRELPVFAALRYPERFLWVAILLACEPAANALAKLPRLGDGPKWRLGANIVLTGALLVTVASQLQTFAEVEGARELGSLAPNEVQGDAGDFRQARGNRWLAAHYPGIGRGSLSCWEAYPVVMSEKLRGDLEAEEYLADPSAGRVQRVRWSPNRIVVHVALSRPARLLVNQNWHPGWRSSRGLLLSDDGLLAVDLPAGEADVTLHFAPMSAIAGATVTLVALAALVGLALMGRRGRLSFRRPTMPASLALVAAPWAAFGVLAATWSEPRYPPPPTRNADGSPGLVTAAAPAAALVGARFDLPLTLEAVRVAGPDHQRNLAIELYLRRTGTIPRTTGMFVHFVRQPGQPPIPDKEISVNGGEKEKLKDFLNADHQVVGGSFYISDAPLGILVHDSFGMNVARLAPGQYDALVGFGHVSGRRGRARVVDAGPTKAVVEDDLIRIGSFVVH
jgi:hypothetical protein